VYQFIIIIIYFTIHYSLIHYLNTHQIHSASIFVINLTDK